MKNLSTQAVLRTCLLSKHKVMGSTPDRSS